MRRILKTLLKLAAALLGLALLVWTGLALVPNTSPVAPITPRETTDYWPMSGGYRIAYTRVPAVEPGDPPRPPVLFLHGGPGGYIYTSTIETMGRFAEAGRDVYLYDQVGSGLSDRLPRPKDYSFERHLEDLREIVVERIGADRAVLIGQSYGGVLVAHFLAAHPELVEGAVLTSPGALEPSAFVDGRWVNLDKYPVPPSLEFIEPYNFHHDTTLRAMTPRTITALVFAQLFDVKLIDDLEADGELNEMAAKITRGVVCDPANVHPEEGGGGFYSHYWGNWYGDLEDPRPALAQVATPVLVLHGQCDFVSYPATYEYADLMPNAEYRFIEGAGHEIWWDREEVFVEEIRRFLERLGDA